MKKSVIFWALFISLALHLGSLVRLGQVSKDDLSRRKTRALAKNKRKVKVRLVQSKKKVKQNPKKEIKKILETPLAKTEPPKDVSRLGAQDHKTKKETKVVQKRKKPKGMDAAQASPFKKSKIVGKGNGIPKPKRSKPTNPLKARVNKLADRGRISIKKSKHSKKRQMYESLLPSARELGGQIRVGYQDFIADDLAVSDRVDMNTSEYRFIGYFSSMRKAIELVWSYPSEAVRKQIQGVVELEFRVEKSGETDRIKILQSSGFQILDRNIVKAIRNAQPFSPLPKSYDKEVLVVTASFHYVLSGMPVAH